MILESTKQAFKDVRITHIQELYDAGMESLEDEMFQEALTAFNEVVRLDPGFEEAERWAQIAYCEPRYRDAMKHFEQQQWRSAHALFSDVVAEDPQFKEAE